MAFQAHPASDARACNKPFDDRRSLCKFPRSPYFQLQMAFGESELAGLNGFWRAQRDLGRRLCDLFLATFHIFPPRLWFSGDGILQPIKL
jgi:hypothetical protein